MGIEFSDYGEYDVVYFHKPLAAADKMIEMEERILHLAGQQIANGIVRRPMIEPSNLVCIT